MKTLLALMALAIASSNAMMGEGMGECPSDSEMEEMKVKIQDQVMSTMNNAYCAAGYFLPDPRNMCTYMYSKNCEDDMNCEDIARKCCYALVDEHMFTHVHECLPQAFGVKMETNNMTLAKMTMMQCLEGKKNLPEPLGDDERKNLEICVNNKLDKPHELTDNAVEAVKMAVKGNFCNFPKEPCPMDYIGVGKCLMNICLFEEYQDLQ